MLFRYKLEKMSGLRRLRKPEDRGQYQKESNLFLMQYRKEHAYENSPECGVDYRDLF